MEYKELVNHHTQLIKDQNDNKWAVIETSDLEEICEAYHQRKLKLLHIADVMSSAYFDIPNSEMNYATYSTKAYFDEQGWYLIDYDGKKQYEDEKWLNVSPHYA